jgi:hypothetical protein
MPKAQSPGLGRARSDATQATVPQPSPVGDNILPLPGQTHDAEFHHVARLQIAPRLPPHVDARRRAGRNDVAGMERDEPGQVAGHAGGAVYHSLGRYVLHRRAIYDQPQRQVLAIGDLIPRHQPRTNLVEAFAVFSLLH